MLKTGKRQQCLKWDKHSQWAHQNGWIFGNDSLTTADEQLWNKMQRQTTAAGHVESPGWVRQYVVAGCINQKQMSNNARNLNINKMMHKQHRRCVIVKLVRRYQLISGFWRNHRDICSRCTTIKKAAHPFFFPVSLVLFYSSLSDL